MKSVATEREVVDVLRMLYAAYPRHQAAPQTVQLFVDGMSDLPASELRAAAAAWVRTERYPPSLAELRAAVLELRRLSGTRSQPQTTADDPRLQHKFALYAANVRDWMAGRYGTAEMILRGAMIYATVPPVPADGEDVRRDAEAYVRKLGADHRPTGRGNLLRALSRIGT